MMTASSKRAGVIDVVILDGTACTMVSKIELFHWYGLRQICRDRHVWKSWGTVRFVVRINAAPLRDPVFSGVK